MFKYYNRVMPVYFAFFFTLLGAIDSQAENAPPTKNTPRAFQSTQSGKAENDKITQSLTPEVLALIISHDTLTHGLHSKETPTPTNPLIGGAVRNAHVARQIYSNILRYLAGTQTFRKNEETKKKRPASVQPTKAQAIADLELRLSKIKTELKTDQIPDLSAEFPENIRTETAGALPLSPKNLRESEVTLLENLISDLKVEKPKTVPKIIVYNPPKGTSKTKVRIDSKDSVLRGNASPERPNPGSASSLE